MTPVVLGTLIASAGLGVHLEEVVDLPLRDASLVAERFADAAAKRAAVSVRIDDPLAPRCRRRSARPRCIGEVAARTAATDLVFVRLIGGVTKIRVVAERVDITGRSLAEGTVNLPRTTEDWRRTLDRLARTLFPSPLATSPPPASDVVVAATPESDAEASSGFVRAAPWIVVGVGVTAGAVGVAFGASSADARDRIENQALTDEAYVDALGQMQDHGTAANVLFGVGIGAAVTGIAWLILR